MPAVEFKADLSASLDGLAASWAAILAAVTALSPDDLGKRRRGEWDVRGVLQHVLMSALDYARMLADLRCLETERTNVRKPGIDSVASSVAELVLARDLHFQLLDGVDEDTFYRLQDTHHDQEYSVRSVISNVVMHHDEHLQQIREILSTAEDAPT